MVGWDGADWRIARPLLEAGRLPHLAGLVERGVTAELETLRPTLSPIVWTSIATGVSPERHGILGFWRPSAHGESGAADGALADQLGAIGYVERSRPGMRFYESGDRRAPALWNLAANEEARAHVYGWWVSYPAESIDGRIVSDRFFYSRFDEEVTRRGVGYERGGALVHPGELEAELDGLVVTPQDIPDESLFRFVGEPPPFERFQPDDPVGELLVALARDESVAAVVDAGLTDETPELVMITFQGIDIASHYFYRHRFPEDWGWTFPGNPVPVDEIERFGGAVDAYYVHLDETLGEILRHAGPDTAVVLCSDHGFTLGRREDAASISGVHHNAAPPGMLVLSGAGIRRGARLSRAHVYDVAPTVLALLGLELEGGDGRPLTEALVSPE